MARLAGSCPVANKDHVPIVNDAFTPTAEEVAVWRDIDRLATEAEARDERFVYGDVNQGEGHEVHIAHVATARRLLEWARALGVG